MSNAKRPTTARTRTPKDEASRKAVLDATMTIRIDDAIYSIRPADVTGLLDMRVRRETGMSVTEIGLKLQESPGVDLVGCFMFACELAAGREADLEKILGSVSMDSDCEIVDGDGDPVPQL